MKDELRQDIQDLIRRHGVNAMAAFLAMGRDSVAALCLDAEDEPAGTYAVDPVWITEIDGCPLS